MDISGANSLFITGYQNSGSSQWQYQVGVDQDGDGRVDEKSAMSEAELNNLLAPLGVLFDNGVQQSIDGFAVTPGNRPIINNLSADPVLPNTSGGNAAPHILNERLGGLDAKSTGAAALAWMALSEMARTSMKELKLAKELRNALQRGKFEEKQASLDAQALKIDAERAAAWTSFAWQAAAATVSIGAGASAAGKLPGFLGSFNNISSTTAQAAIQSSQMLGPLGTAIDKNWGYQADADELELYSKSRDIEADKIDMYIDEAQSNYQEAKQAMEKAIKILEDVAQRKTDIVNTITR